MVFLNSFLNLFSYNKNSSIRQGLPGTALGTMSRWKCHQLPGNIKTRALFLHYFHCPLLPSPEFMMVLDISPGVLYHSQNLLLSNLNQSVSLGLAAAVVQLLQ